MFKNICVIPSFPTIDIIFDYRLRVILPNVKLRNEGCIIIYNVPLNLEVIPGSCLENINLEKRKKKKEILDYQLHFNITITDSIYK